VATPCTVTPSVQHNISFGCPVWKVPANLIQLFSSRESTKHFRCVKLILMAIPSVCRAATLVQQGEIFQGRNTLAAQTSREGRDIFLFWSLGPIYGLAPFPGESAAVSLGGFFPLAAHWKVVWKCGQAVGSAGAGRQGCTGRWVVWTTPSPLVHPLMPV